MTAAFFEVDAQTVVDGVLKEPGGVPTQPQPLQLTAARVCVQNAPVTISGPGATLDGVTMALNDRVVLVAQSNHSFDGVYLFKTATTAMVRAADANDTGEIRQGTYIDITSGTHADERWTQQALPSGAMGAWAQNWTSPTPHPHGVNPPEPDPLTTTIYGTSMGDPPPDYDGLKAMYGSVNGYRHFYPPTAVLPSNFMNTADLAETYNGGTRAFVISIKWGDAPLDGADSLIAGAHDNEIETFCESVPANAKVWLCWFHEPDAPDPGFTAAQKQKWRDAWGAFGAAVHRGADANSNAGVRIRTTMILTRDSIARSAWPYPYWRDYFNPDAVDVIGFDSYNGGWPDAYANVNNRLDPIIRLAADVNKYWGVGEFGSDRITSDTTGSGRANWVEAYCNKGKNATPRAEFMFYWNAIGGGPDFRIQAGDTAEVNKFRPFIGA